jgi:hypothetical protein
MTPTDQLKHLMSFMLFIKFTTLVELIYSAGSKYPQGCHTIHIRRKPFRPVWECKGARPVRDRA